MSHRRDALIIATTRHDDPGLRQLRPAAADVEPLAGVLRKDYTVTELVDVPADRVAAGIAGFFAGRDPGDELLLHVACHAIQADSLVFATPETDRARPEATGVPAAVIQDALAACAAEQRVVILDCCFSGPRQTEVDLSGFARHAQLFITASNTTEYTFDNGMIRGRGRHSKLTADLADALRTGAADRDADGLITAADLAAHLTAAASEVRRPDLLVARGPYPGVQPPPAAEAVREKPPRTAGEWAIRVLRTGIVLLLLSLLAMLALGWFLYRINWLPEWRTDLLDVITWTFMAGAVVAGVGLVFGVVAMVLRKVRLSRRYRP